MFPALPFPPPVMDVLTASESVERDSVQGHPKTVVSNPHPLEH